MSNYYWEQEENCTRFQACTRQAIQTQFREETDISRPVTVGRQPHTLTQADTQEASRWHLSSSRTEQHDEETSADYVQHLNSGSQGT